jgi:N-acetylneuraminic acid mutarotase
MVLVAGGWNNGSLSSAELYDLKTGTWTTTSSMNTGRTWHTATLLLNGEVLVAGGYSYNNNTGVSSIVSSADLYNPKTGTWSATGTMSTTRNIHTATLLPSGKVLVAGGENNSFVPLNSCDLYTPSNTRH